MYLVDISTHALTEGDADGNATRQMMQEFQLTPSRRATNPKANTKDVTYISTHALTEGDTESQKELHEKYISTHALTEGDRRSFLPG